MTVKERRLYIVAGILVLGILILLVYSSSAAQQRIREDEQLEILRVSGHTIQDHNGIPREGIFLQALIDALNHPQRVEEIYEGFSAKQRNDASYEVFVEYLALLRAHQQGQIQGFAPLPQRTAEAYEDDMLVASLPVEGVTAKYYYLEEIAVPEDERLIIRILTKDSEAMLDGKYMQSTLDLYQHAGLYFAALSETNIEALTQLVHSDINEPDLKRRKAQETLTFYQTHGFDTSLQPDALEISPDYLHLRLTSTFFLDDIERTPGETPVRAQHDLVFERTEEGIIIRDLIPMPELLKLRYISTKEPLDVGRQQFELSELESSELAAQILLSPELRTFGLDYDPLETTAKRSEEEAEVHYLRSLDQDKVRLVLSYPSEEARDDDRHASLIYLSLREDSPMWDFDSELKLFMDREAVLDLYPFLDVYNYRVGLSPDLGLRFIFDSQNRLQRVDYLSPEWLGLSSHLDQAKGTAFFR